MLKKKKGELVFHTKTGGLINRGDVDRCLNNMLIRAEIEKKVTLHDLRRTYSSELNREGIDNMIIQYLMGHISFSTTEKFYLKVLKEDVLKITGALK